MDKPFSGPLKTSLNSWLTETETAAFFDAHSEGMRTRASTLQPFPGVHDLLRSLPASSASIVSSAYNDAIRSVLSGHNGTLPACIGTLCGRDRRLSKTEKIKEVLHAEKLEPTDAVYVGDLESDLLYCRSVPLECVLVTYGYHSPAYLRRIESDTRAIADSVDELRVLLLGLMGIGKS
jgi:phosphoglycolate phosphatase